MAIKKSRTVWEMLTEYFGDLEEEFDRWKANLERPSWNRKNCTVEPLHDLKITPTEVVVTVDLPLTVKSKVQVKPLDDNVLEISAEMKRKVRFSELGITHCKGEFQKYHSHSRIPVPVDMEKMQIEYKKGLLEIHLPRKHK